MNDQELVTAVRQSVGRARMDVPEEQITSRGRAIRASRRRRVAAGVTAIASAGAAAIAAALVLPGSAAPAAQHAQDTAYVVSRVTQALDAVPAGAILFTKASSAPPGGVLWETWERGPDSRYEYFASGKLVTQLGTSVKGNTVTQVDISYQDRTWSRSALHRHLRQKTSPATDGGTILTCRGKTFEIPGGASMMAALLRAWESCGDVKADGTATVGGVTAIRLSMPTEFGLTTTWYVSPETYLVIRKTVTRRGVLLSTLDFQWLPPNAANLATLSLPAAPQGFTKVPPDAQP